MSDIYIVAYDGSEGARRTADFAVERAQLAGAKLHIVHVLEWSAYSFLTPDELNERHKRRQEELERANQHLLKPLLDKLDQAGHPASGEVRYGNVAAIIHDVAKEQNAKLIYIAKSSDSRLSSFILGNVPGTLIQIASIPVVVVP